MVGADGQCQSGGGLSLLTYKPMIFESDQRLPEQGPKEEKVDGPHSRKREYGPSVLGLRMLMARWPDRLW